MHESLWWVICTYFYELIPDTILVQNCSKKYRCLKKLLRLLLGGVGWGLGTLFAGQGDTNKVFIINTISSWLPHVLDHKSSSPSPGHYNPALSVAGHASRAQYVTTWKVTISYSLKTPIRYDTLPLGTWAPGQCWAAAAGGARGAALGRRETVRKAAAGPRPIFFQRHKHLEGRSCPGTVRTRWGWQPGWTTLQLGKVARVECQHTLVQVNTCRAMPIPCFRFIWTYSKIELFL